MNTDFPRESWCSACEVHLSTPWNPLCPGCAADRARDIRDKTREGTS